MKFTFYISLLTTLLFVSVVSDSKTNRDQWHFKYKSIVYNLIGWPESDIIYKGKYEVDLQKPNDTLNCRSKPDLNGEIIKEYYHRNIINVLKVVKPKKPWLLTQDKCYVRGNAAYLVWRGGYEDPNSMCDWRKENC